MFPYSLISDIGNSCLLCFLFLFIKKNMYLSIYWVLVAQGISDLSCGTQDLLAAAGKLWLRMWDLVPWSGIEPSGSALEAQSLNY